MKSSIANFRRGWFVSLVALLIAGCVQVPVENPEQVVKPLVFPEPPDEPRFIYERTVFGSADAVAGGPSAAVDAVIEVDDNVGLGKPYAIAVKKGAMYVSDSATNEVKVFDVAEAKYRTVGKDEKDPLGKPLGLDVDDQGNVYVADSTAKAVKVYDKEGKFLRRIGGPNDFDRLSSVTVDANGARLYVVDIGGVQSEKHRVRVFDAVSGKHLFDIGKRGSKPGEFNLPRDVAVGKDGNIIVVDGGNFRVQVFDRDGRYMHSFGRVGRSWGEFARPKEVATDSEGNIYVVDAAFGNFQIFNPNGDLLLFVGTRSEESAPAKYMLPAGIAVDEDGRVYMVDQWFRKIDIFRPYAMKGEEGYLVHPSVRAAREAKRAGGSAAASAAKPSTAADSGSATKK